VTRPLLEIADLIRTAGAAFIERNHQWIRWRHVKVLLAIARCRTAALGGHIDECTRCAHRVPISYNSCRNRHLPKVSDCRSRTVDCCSSPRTSAHPLPARGLHPAEKFKLLSQPKIFAAWLRPLFRQHWVVYLKRPFGGPEYVLHYLGRYTHRVAISNHRLVSFVDGQVTFRWRDSANQHQLTALSHDRFLRRFLLHLLPKGFVRIRHFGFLACRRRASTLPICFQLLGAAQEPPEQRHPPSQESQQKDQPDLYRCPKCGAPMKVIERLTAAEIQFRSPPSIRPAA